MSFPFDRWGEKKTFKLCVCVCVCVYVCVLFLGPHLGHMEVPRLGVNSEL